MRRIALGLLGLLAPLVPRSSRVRWIEEWRAEIDHAAAAFDGRPFPSLRLLRMASGAIPDAVLLRRPRGRIFQGLGQDFRYSLRALAAAPAFSLAVIGSLTLGIAANAAAFAFINALFFRPFPGVDAPDRLVRIELCRLTHAGNCVGQSSSYDDYVAMRAALPSLHALSARVQVLAAGRVRGEPVALRAAVVSPNYFDVLGARLALGGGFAPGESASEQAVAVIGHALWQGQFQRDPGVLGESVNVGTTAVRIVGVASEDFLGATGTPGNAGRDIWVPFALADAVIGRAPAGPSSRERRDGEHDIEYVGRLAPGTALQQARSEADVFAARLNAARPDTPAGGAARVSRYSMKNPADAVAAVATIMPLPLLVLAIACLNAASLLLARATYRMRDTSVRLALGATRWRIVRHVLAESVLLAAVAAAASVPLTVWTIGLAQPYMPMSIPIDWHVLGFTLLVALASALLFGVLPAVRAASRTVPRRLGSSRHGDAAMSAPRLRKALVIAQVAASLALLATGSQSMTAVSKLVSNTGAEDPERLLLASFDLDTLKLSPDAGREFYTRLLDRVALMPQVEAAGLARSTAMWTFGLGRGGSFVVGWLPDDEPKNGRAYLGGYVRGALFQAIGLKLIQGRGFTSADAGPRPQVAIVNRPMAERLFGGAAIGRSIRVATRGRHEESLEVLIVGVIEPTIERSYSPQPVPAIYLPAPLQDEPALTLYVRSRTPAETLVPALRQAVAAVDPRVPFIEVGTLQERTEHRNLEERILATGATMLGGVALLLATAGLYGLFSFIVSLRQREIGVRMALGAEPRSVLRLVLRQAMRLALVGAAIGGVVAISAGAIVTANVYGTPGIDPLAFTASAALLLAAMLAAGFVPAWRAAHVDPMVILREE